MHSYDFSPTYQFVHALQRWCGLQRSQELIAQEHATVRVGARMVTVS